MKWCKPFILLGLLLLVATAVSARQMEFYWEYTDAVPEDVVVEFRIFYGPTSHRSVTKPASGSGPAPYEVMIPVLDPNARTHTIDFPQGLYYGRMTTVYQLNGEMIQSDFSSEVAFFVGAVAPAKVGVRSAGE